MKYVAIVITCIAVLSGCAPMALLASGSGPEYRGYKSNLGVLVSHSNVNTLCLSPALRLVIWDFEGYFGKKVVMSSGYRTPWHNASVGGADQSLHVRCMAADFYIPGVPKHKLIAFARRNGMVGGLGCYPGQKFIHVDVRSRPASGPITFSGCENA